MARRIGKKSSRLEELRKKYVDLKEIIQNYEKNEGISTELLSHLKGQLGEIEREIVTAVVEG